MQKARCIFIKIAGIETAIVNIIAQETFDDVKSKSINKYDGNIYKYGMIRMYYLEQLDGI